MFDLTGYKKLGLTVPGRYTHVPCECEPSKSYRYYIKPAVALKQEAAITLAKKRKDHITLMKCSDITIDKSSNKLIKCRYLLEQLFDELTKENNL